MNTEVSRDSNSQKAFKGLFMVAFPLLDHKMDSDRQGKHEKWTSCEHVVLTILAILVDLGFNSEMVALFLSGNVPGAGVLKFAHIVGSQTLPEPITQIKNKIIGRKNFTPLSTPLHPK
jgi:hypothetical protein